MIIQSPTIEQRGNKNLIKATVKLAKRRYLSRDIWFEVPVGYVQGKLALNEPFVVAVLFMAMSLAEDIKVSGNFSPRLLSNLKQYQEIFHFWFPRQLQVINIKADSYQAINWTGNARQSATFFSGGIDSTYTLYCHLLGRQQLSQHTKLCIFVHGWDIPLWHRQTYELLKQRYQRCLTKLGVSIIPVRTNLRELLFHAHVGWDMTHGTALGAVALLLRSSLARVYIPGSRRYDRNPKIGSNLISDSLLSTENVAIIHHGSDQTRLDKTIAISAWRPSYNWLKVCWMKSKLVDNCGRCEKCLRSMVPLVVAGVLSKYKTFPHALPANTWRKWRLIHDYEYDRMDDLIAYAKSKNKLDLLARLTEVKQKSRRRQSISWLKKKLMQKAYYYFLRAKDLARLSIDKVLPSRS